MAPKLKPWLIVDRDVGHGAKILAQCDTEREADNHKVGGYMMTREAYLNPPRTCPTCKGHGTIREPRRETP